MGCRISGRYGHLPERVRCTRPLQIDANETRVFYTSLDWAVNGYDIKSAMVDHARNIFMCFDDISDSAFLTFQMFNFFLNKRCPE